MISEDELLDLISEKSGQEDKPGKKNSGIAVRMDKTLKAGSTSNLDTILDNKSRHQINH